MCCGFQTLAAAQKCLEMFSRGRRTLHGDDPRRLDMLLVDASHQLSNPVPLHKQLARRALQLSENTRIIPVAYPILLLALLHSDLMEMLLAHGEDGGNQLMILKSEPDHRHLCGSQLSLRPSVSRIIFIISVRRHRTEIMEIMQMLSLEEQTDAGEEELRDELEDLSTRLAHKFTEPSMRALVEAGGEEPKLQYLMMDQSFSMVTLQNQNSTITWETARTHAHTPVHTHTLPVAPASAGKILFIMDEEMMSRRKRKKERSAPEQVSLEILAAAERPAMVEVALPNTCTIEGGEERREHTGEETLFSLVSEGSEILNIIAPHGISMMDEEESRGLEDQLFYLEQKNTEFSEINLTPQPEGAELITKDHAEAVISSMLPQPLLTPTGPRQSRGAVSSEDYFEKFTLLDSQAPSGTEPKEPKHETTEKIPEELEEDRVHASEAELIPGISSGESLLDLSGEHLDDVFYGEIDPGASSPSAGDRRREFSRSSVKHSGEVLFSREDSILTPIYLPEGSGKIIDQSLLEEPQALAFLYSDLYSEATGSRKAPEQEDDGDNGSERSFHSQQSDREDRGYLEKFALRVETYGAESDPRIEEHPGEPLRFTAFPELCEDRGVVMEEVTDFFRDSASSSPREFLEMNREDEEEEEEVFRIPRVSFREDTQPLVEQEELDEEEFLPVEISEQCPAWEENLPSTRSLWEEDQRKPPPPEQAQKEMQPRVQCKAKPYLDLSALTPAENQEKRSGAGEAAIEMLSDEAGSAGGINPFTLNQVLSRLLESSWNSCHLEPELTRGDINPCPPWERLPQTLMMVHELL
ncbi:hypothetical protein DNTS_009419 [Danionella cerebrum]|uniref:Uncharacterized protein n=1 Tax=Danionella cerebrum TaxID=2873325 RepID=A0A553NIE9_9TELE|nr:hypothetical protein DNTS_009419 [Danionella translucida]